ncbi:MAG TPA: response regulator [Bryobacteraceae bacterium]|nr:response regulator [Bryobacteraceae bacterium]
MADSANILLVDDEPALVRLMQIYLVKLGYTVESCMDCASAEKLFRERSGNFELLVADLTLPDSPGDQMARRMAEQNPKLKVLLCSGYPFEVSVLPEALRSRFATLQKPFLPKMLESSVRDLLNKPRP